MFKSFVLSIALAVASCAPAFASEVVPFQAVSDATVQVGGNCSGTIIKSDRDEVSGKVETIILTAKHCTHKVGQAIVVDIFNYDDDLRRINKVSHLANVRGQYFAGDLAIIQLVDTKTLFTTVSKVAMKDFTPFRSQEVLAIGYPFGLEKTVTFGRFMNRITDNRFPIKEEVFLATVAVAGGSSGGGLYALIDGEYQLIGVTSMTAPGFPLSMYVPVDQIRKYIDIALR